ncbi:hypothetical protein [Cupriavidus campinensis]
MLIDEADAAEVERAWTRLMPFDKDVLRLYYIWEALPHIMCRRLRIRYRPASVLELAMAHAKRDRQGPAQHRGIAGGCKGSAAYCAAK